MAESEVLVLEIMNGALRQASENLIKTNEQIGNGDLLAGQSRQPGPYLLAGQSR